MEFSDFGCLKTGGLRGGRTRRTRIWSPFFISSTPPGREIPFYFFLLLNNFHFLIVFEISSCLLGIYFLLLLLWALHFAVIALGLVYFQIELSKTRPAIFSMTTAILYFSLWKFLSMTDEQWWHHHLSNLSGVGLWLQILMMDSQIRLGQQLELGKNQSQWKMAVLKIIRELENVQEGKNVSMEKWSGGSNTFSNALNVTPSTIGGVNRKWTKLSTLISKKQLGIVDAVAFSSHP